METQNISENSNDPCYRILRDAPIDAVLKRDIWYDFYESASAKAFATQIERFGLEQTLRDALVAARKSLDPSGHEHVAAAIQKLSQIEPQTLALAEKHPNVLRALIEAARESEK